MHTCMKQNGWIRTELQISDPLRWKQYSTFRVNTYVFCLVLAA